MALDNTEEDEVPLATRSNHLHNIFLSEDEAPLASIKATKAKRPRAKPVKRRVETPEELETTVPVKPFIVEPPTKELKGWKGWAIVEEHENEEKEEVDAVAINWSAHEI
ncbi:hypothetical protein DFH28DRAFT_921291 [Melampsora americana]|nr:hypothetical protein DFH28DRAFT_921291 [Melampsora americana]